MLLWEGANPSAGSGNQPAFAPQTPSDKPGGEAQRTAESYARIDEEARGGDWAILRPGSYAASMLSGWAWVSVSERARNLLNLTNGSVLGSVLVNEGIKPPLLPRFLQR